MSWYGSNEQDLLRQFWGRIAEIRPTLFITHNGLGFDLPFIKKRSIIHRVKPSLEISLAKFRTEPVYDTMAVWSNWDMRGWIKLDILARALNVETKSAGHRQEIAEYWLQDTYVTYACYTRMTFREPLMSQDILKSPQLIETSKRVFAPFCFKGASRYFCGSLFWN